MPLKAHTPRESGRKRKRENERTTKHHRFRPRHEGHPQALEPVGEADPGQHALVHGVGVRAVLDGEPPGSTETSTARGPRDAIRAAASVASLTLRAPSDRPRSFHGSAPRGSFQTRGIGLYPTIGERSADA